MSKKDAITHSGSPCIPTSSPIGIAICCEMKVAVARKKNTLSWGAFDIAEELMGGIQVRLARCSHELAKDMNTIDKVGSRDREVDESSNQASILGRVLKGLALVVSEDKILVHGDSSRFGAYESCIFKKLKCIFALT